MGRRRELMSLQTSGLPGAYRQVEYIQSNGNSYIDTGVPITTDLALEMTIKTPQPTASRYIAGNYLNNGAFYIYSTGSSMLQTSYGCSYKNSTYRLDADKHGLRYEITNGNTYLYLDNSVVMQNGALSSMPSSSIIIAGATNNPTQAVNTYSAKMMKNGGIIRNYIPCVRKSDSKPGMYDTVTKTFYTNAGTGEFIVPA